MTHAITKNNIISNFIYQVGYMYFNCRMDMKCVFPENVHTPTTEGHRNSEGYGGLKKANFRRGGGYIKNTSRAFFFPTV